MTIIAIGTMVSRALEAADRLRRDGIGARVINTAFVDPLDEQAVLDAASETRAIITAEEATVSGGLGAAVAAIVVEHQPVPMRASSASAASSRLRAARRTCSTTSRSTRTASSAAHEVLAPRAV